MNRKLLFSLALLGMAGGGAIYSWQQDEMARIYNYPAYGDVETASGDTAADPPRIGEVVSTGKFAGRFLASHFAQSRYDWKAANRFLDGIIAHDPQNYELIKRSMVLAMGYGDLDLAAQRAQELLAIEKDNSLALLFVAVNALAKGNMDSAAADLARMPDGDMTDFIKPLLKAWVDAGKGQFKTAAFNETFIHRYHEGLIAIYLGNMNAAAVAADAIAQSAPPGGQEAERAADLYAAAGQGEKAVALYEAIEAEGMSRRLKDEKIAASKAKDAARLAALLAPLKVKSPAQGAAMTMFDMALMLYQEGSDNSAKLFANMALALDPAMPEARILLADTLARNERFDEAITHLTAVPKDHPAYIESQRHAAQLLAQAGRMNEALALLNRLFMDHNDVESLIRIGDLYREKENYDSALKAYNRAATQIGETIPEEYWHLLYARGMAYEREGDWKKAETDLKAALGYRPDHPYLLNYLGYGWADKGENLEQSLELIQKAVTLRPSDGFIIDSLGWVQYMMGRYEDAIVNLEKAVELLPYDATINDHLGDAYWQVGRRIEARFQWERALNNGADQTLQAKIADKLHAGLPPAVTAVKHASSEMPVEAGSQQKQ